MNDPVRMMCPECGTDNEARARFCSYCGGMLSRPWALAAEPEHAAAAVSAAPAPAREFPTTDEAREFQELMSRSSVPDPSLTQSEWADPAYAQASSAPRLRPAEKVAPWAPKLPPRVPPASPEAAFAAPAAASEPVGGPLGMQASAPRKEVVAMDTVTPSRKPAGGSMFRTVGWIVGATLVTGLVGYAAAVTFIKPGGVDRLASQPALKSATEGRLVVEVPSALPSGSLWVTVLQNGKTVKSPGGELLERKSPEKLGGVSLAPGSYTVRFVYRRTPLREVRAEIRKSEDSVVQPSRWQLADIEYSAGEAAAKTGGQGVYGDTDVAHFQRTLKLDPDHVNAHLQMAVYELLRGTPMEVRQHLESVRRIAPRHAELPKIEALLEKRKRGS